MVTWHISTYPNDLGTYTYYREGTYTYDYLPRYQPKWPDFTLVPITAWMYAWKLLYTEILNLRHSPGGGCGPGRCRCVPWSSIWEETDEKEVVGVGEVASSPSINNSVM